MQVQQRLAVAARLEADAAHVEGALEGERAVRPGRSSESSPPSAAFRAIVYKKQFPTGTWLEVKGLALPEFMIEIELEARTPNA